MADFTIGTINLQNFNGSETMVSILKYNNFTY